MARPGSLRREARNIVPPQAAEPGHHGRGHTCLFPCYPSSTQLSAWHGAWPARERGPARWSWSEKARPRAVPGLGAPCGLPITLGHPRQPRRPTPLARMLAGCLSSSVFLLLFARPKSSTSPWMACVSPLQRASLSGRGRATATLISLETFSLWTTCMFASCPRRSGGEG